MSTQYAENAKQAILITLDNHRGEENRMSKILLQASVRFKTGVSISDRVLRKFIEELRTDDPKGAWICASLKGGYFIARDMKELDKFTGSDHRRAINLLTRVRKQRRAAGLLVSTQLDMEI